MPTERAATTTTAAAVSIGKKQRKNHTGRWLDKNDHMASDPIEVSDESDDVNPQISKVERVATVKPRKNSIRQRQPRISPSLKDGPRLFGDRTQPDAEGVPIPIPGVDINPMKPGPLRPFNTLNNGPLASKHVLRDPLHSSGHEPQTKASPYFKPKPARNETPGHSQSPYAEGPPRKRRRVQDLRQRSMSSDSPIVIDDDVEMGERDELDFSSDKDQAHSTPNKKHLFTRPPNKTPITATTQIKEYRVVEKMMSSSKPHINAARLPLQVLESNDSSEDDFYSRDSTEDELFTKTSKQQRLEAQREVVPEKPPGRVTTGNSTSAVADNSRTSELPPGISYTSPAGAAKVQAESPDVLQLEVEYMRDASQSRHMPLHQASGSALANTILRGRDISPSQVGRSKPKGISGKVRRPDVRNFFLRQLRFGSLPKDYAYMITIHEEHKTLSICPQRQILEGDITAPIPLRRVSNIHHGENGCTMVMIVMSRVVGAIDDKMHLELHSDKEVYDFVTCVQRLAGGNTNVDTKPSSWLQSAFERHEQPRARCNAKSEPNEAQTVSHPRRSIPATSSDLTGSGISKFVRTHEKHTDRLEGLHPASRSVLNGLASKASTIITGKERGTYDAGERVPTDGSSGEKPPATKASVSKYFEPRATRSSALKHAPPENIETDIVKQKVKLSETGGLGRPWKKPLVYPKFGKKRETVDFQDLERLNDNEFLNDNLIGFYLRYLEYYLEKEKPEIAKKVYFFNSYFFERLTQTQKGIKGINYAAVQKWTRTVDIFSRDFVVVPVNENLHWYVAIICNLPNLRRKLADDEEDEIESIDTSETIPAAKGDAQGEAEMTEEQVEEPDGETRSSFAGLSLRDDSKVASAHVDAPTLASDVKPRSPQKKKKGPGGRRKSGRRSLIKIDPNKPVIITLDSLGLSRTTTRTTLKDYIVEEGKAKRSLDLERGDLEGVTAKGIPTQKNYSDCGLFLCAYMERFVMDPYQFVHDILQRDMNEGRDWPMMSSDELRSRLRNVIMELHRQQEGEKEIVPIPNVGKILLREPLPPSSPPESEPDVQEIPSETHNTLVDLADEEAASQVYDELTAAANVGARTASSPGMSQRTALKSAEDAVNQSSPEESKPYVRHSPQPAIVIPDDSPISRGPRHMSSKFRAHADIEDDFINGPQELGDNPQALADKMRRARNPTPVQARTRSQSVSTDFLAGLESYARVPSPGKVPGGWANDEIPETQSQEEDSSTEANEVDDLPDITPELRCL